MTFRYVDPKDLRARHRKPALAQEHSVTSRAAAAKIEPHRVSLKARVYDAIAAAGTRGLTDEEGIAATGMSPSTYRPRRIELVEASQVRDSHRQRQTAAGRWAVVWIVTD